MATLHIESTDRVADVRAAFAARWPGLTLDLYNPSFDFYKEGLPDTRDDDQPISTRAEPAGVDVDGSMSEHELRDVLYRAFDVETQIRPPLDGATRLDDAVA